jgi:ribosome-associated toxin RatA of RatAB toxin-antitoxin module
VKTVKIERAVPGWNCDAVYERLKDGETYLARAPEYVKSIVIETTDDPQIAVSHWQLYFRNSILEWTAEDRYDDENFVIQTEQITGDFDELRGCWEVHPIEGDVERGARVVFTGTFDFGIPSVEELVDGLAVNLLTRSIEQLMSEMFD